MKEKNKNTNQKAGQKIGVFDSGLGGVFIADSIRKRLPSYDYLYLGDTLHLPYGRRSDAAICDLSRKAMDYLFDAGCFLVIMACNTASASALRRLQQEFLPRNHPERRILGVVVPTLEAAIEGGARRIGLLGTQRTVQSGIYDVELRKIRPETELTAISCPLLVPMIEEGGRKYLEPVLRDYLEPLRAARVESVILGCTHYVALKEDVARLLPGAAILSQDDIIPHKLEDYLRRHPEIESRLSRGGSFEIHVTDANENFGRSCEILLGEKKPLRQALY